jgi:hypothetical protein
LIFQQTNKQQTNKQTTNKQTNNKQTNKQQTNKQTNNPMLKSHTLQGAQHIEQALVEKLLVGVPISPVRIPTIL